MKKTVSIFLILFVTASLFAAGSVRLASAYGRVIGRTKPFTDGDRDTMVHYRSYGFAPSISLLVSLGAVYYF